VTVLLSILLQSLHTYGHFLKQFSQTECHHKYNVTAADHIVTITVLTTVRSVISHLDRIFPVDFAYKLNENFMKRPCFLETAEIIISFSGSLYSLRAPPVKTWANF
jgi:hypothetical protein